MEYAKPMIQGKKNKSFKRERPSRKPDGFKESMQSPPPDLDRKSENKKITIISSLYSSALTWKTKVAKRGMDGVKRQKHITFFQTVTDWQAKRRD